MNNGTLRKTISGGMAAAMLASTFLIVSPASAGLSPGQIITSKIVFSSDRSGNYNIYSMNDDGSNIVTTLTDNSSNELDPALSPSGKKIAYVSDAGGSLAIYVMNSDGSDQTRLSPNDNPSSDSSPAWSPDGKEIAFQSGSFGQTNIFVMDADGDNRTQLTDTGYDQGPAWSSDGARIAFSSFRDPIEISPPGITQRLGEIYLMDADGDNQTRMTYDGASDIEPTWSPDGTKIAFASDNGTSMGLYVMDKDGSDEKALGGAGHSPTWSPDGGKIAFVDMLNGNNEIFVIPSDGSGTRVQLTRNYSEDDDPSYAAPNGDSPPQLEPIAPLSVTEGQQLAFTINATDPDDDDLVYSIRNLPSGASFDAGEAAFSWTPEYGQAGTYAPCFGVSDGVITVSENVSITVLSSNRPPVVDAVAVSTNVVRVGQHVSANATFSDPDSADIHTATWDWGDGSSSTGDVTETGGSGFVIGDHAYGQTGLYQVVLTVDDGRGGSAQSTFDSVVVYDPAAGFVTGSGWINTAQGDKVTFDVVSRYKKDATRPDGSATIQVHGDKLKLQANSFDWLIVSGEGSAVELQGTCTINGASGYHFLLVFQEGEPANLSITVWQDGTRAAVFNTVGSRPIAGGSVSVHTK